MHKIQAKKLEEIFGNRANFRRTERKLYGHDIAAIASIFKLIVGSTIPDAVVQPENEGELVDLAKWARENKIPLTPRGKASTGYGGAIPVRGGVVVDFYRMRKIKNIDPANMTATVEAGAVFERLDRELMKQGPTLKLYPSSYPAATVGGWLAQGGAGIGSFEAGWFRDNVVSARAVMPDGVLKEFRGSDLGLLSDAEGTTGLISEATLKVQPFEEMEAIAVGCPDAHTLQEGIKTLIEKMLPIWSLLFINPRMAELKNEAPLREHLGHPAEKRVVLPKYYIVTLSFRKKDRDRVMSVLPGMIKECGAVLLSDEIARHEWENRFKIMIVKRLGPSLVPAEVVVPLSSPADVMDEIQAKVDQPVVKEGLVIREGRDGKPEVVILAFIPSDQRKFSYSFVFGLTLTITKIAEKYGGRAYATGLYFSRKAHRILGKERMARLRGLPT